MSLSLTRFCTRHVFLYVVAPAMVLAVGAFAAATAADKSTDAQKPTAASQDDDATQSKNATPSEDVAKSDKPAQSEKSAEPEKTTEVAEPEKKTDDTKKSDDAKKSDADKKPETEKKPDVVDADKKPDVTPEKKTADKESPKPLSVGEPLAAGMIKLLQEEILAGIKRRGITDRFARFQRYAIGRVNASAGKYTGSELAGNCRLRWYDHLMRNLIAAPAESEQFTRGLHMAALDGQGGFAQLLALAAPKMDAGQRKACKFVPPTSPEQAIDIIKQSLVKAQIAYCAAIAPLSKSELGELERYLVPVLSTQNTVGHTLADRGTGRRMCDLIEKMDRESLHSAAEALAPIADARLLEQLKSLPANGNVKVPGVSGTVVSRIETPAGAIVIGGKDSNIYQLDQMRDVAVVIDVDGNDAYQDGSVGRDRPVLVVIDVAGNDVYRGNKPGIQGAAVLGVSMLVDFSGDDIYQAQDVAQGTSLAGVGILIDYAGNDRYTGIRRVQGTAVGGVGILIDRAGKDDYHAAMWAQGVGGPLGFGLLDDLQGADHYYCGGQWRNSYYPETPGMEGWGQGAGEGIRQVANGGIGVILDGAGDDVYEFDYLSHGGGYWCGLGFARDFGGNDQRLIARTSYNGGPRTQTSFQRFGCGWGCHYALGFCFDDAGNDIYEGSIMGSGMAWDCSMGILCDFAGNDQYKATQGLTQGTGAQMGFGVLFDYLGEDVYEGYGQGYASTNLTYHDPQSCGGNYGWLVDYGGKDKYGCGAQDNCFIQRGDVGGFLIDRPRKDEIEATAASKPESPDAPTATTKPTPKTRGT